MEYTIDRTVLFPLIEEEVSRVANESYTDDGDSMYDVIRLTSLDNATIVRLEDDAIDALVKRTIDICTYNGSVLYFDVPDFDTYLESATTREITRYIVLNTCAAWFQSRMPGKVDEYANRGQVAMDKAVTYLKSIKAPERV